MNPWDAAALSVFRNAKDATPAKTTTIANTLATIQRGTYAQAIANLRAMRDVATSEAYSRAKGRLPAVTFGGTFQPTRGKAHLVTHSGIVHGDIDHLTAVRMVEQALSRDPSVAYCFISPSGDGLKLGVRVAPVTTDEAYKHAWQVVSDSFKQRHGVTWDPSGTDISRLCFLSWDTDLFLNPEPTVVMVLPPAHRQAPPSSSSSMAPGGVCPFTGRAASVQQALDAAVALIDRSVPGTRHRARTKAAYLLGGYIGAGLLTSEQASAVLATAVARNTTDLTRALQTITACLEAGRRRPVSFQHSASGQPDPTVPFSLRDTTEGVLWNA